MFNSSLTLTSFMMSFFYRVSMIWLNARGNRYDAMLDSQHCIVLFFFSVILEGITAGMQGNPAVNINILSWHKYFSGCYDVRVCVHFSKDLGLSLLELPGWLLPVCGFVQSRQSDFQTRGKKKKKRRGRVWALMMMEGQSLRIGQQETLGVSVECRLGRGQRSGHFKCNALIEAHTVQDWGF